MSKVLVTGIAGYIGSSVANLLCQDGHQVIGLDNLSTGLEEFIPKGTEFVHGDVTDSEIMQNLGKKVDGVVHIAGIKYAGESFKYPEFFYKTNTLGALNAGIAARNSKLGAIVFSSSCSVYGDVLESNATENFKMNPVSSYGKSKLMAETILGDFAAAYGIKFVSLRYFNVVGASKFGAYDRSEFNLFPNLCRSVINKTPFTLYGVNLPTYDGTSIRDYVDVNDIGRAHVIAFEKMIKEEKLGSTYNLGSGFGTSVLEVINLFKSITQKEIEIEYSQARNGDPLAIISNYTSALLDMGWMPEISISESIKSQLRHFQNYT